MRYKLRSILIMSVLVFAGFLGFLNFGVDFATVEGAPLYVGPTSTYKRIQDAIDNATAGDTIYVDNGTYIESVTINKNFIKLIGNSSTDCIIKHHHQGSSSSTFAAGINVTGNGVWISGFNITVSGDYTYGIYSYFGKNNYFLNNTVHTTGQRGHGIHIEDASNHYAINNTIFTSEFLAAGVYVDNSDYNNLIVNRIITSGQHGYGILLQNTDYNNVTNNAILTTGQNGYGMQVFRSSHNIISDNNITTTFTNAYGFYIEYYSQQNNFFNNTIHTKGSGSYCFYMTQGIGSNLYNNTITTENQHGYGFFVQLSYEINITDNNINTTGSNAVGIYFSQNENYTCNENTIKTEGFNAHGVWFSSDSDNGTIKTNNISTTGGNSVGIYIANSNNTNIADNDVDVLDGFGIFLTDSSLNTVQDNNIKIKGFGDDGIQLDYYSDYNDLIGNTINATGQFGRGIRIEMSANYNTIIDNTINNSGSGGDGIILYNSIDTTIFNCHVNVTGPSAKAVHVDNSTVTVFDSELISTKSDDLYVAFDGNLTVINSEFTDVNAVQDFGGVIQVGNYLSLQAYYEDAITPIQDADVSVTDNGMPVYSTSGYGGTDPMTDSAGQVKDIVVIDRWYFYSNSATENTTNVKVKKTVDTTWEGVRNVNMSTTHTEIFIATDMSIPITPTNFTGAPVPGGDAMNLSWNLSTDDTEKFELWWRPTTNSSWEMVGNFSNTTSWFVWENVSLVNGTYHYFKLRAWDDAGNPSNFTNILNITHRDYKPPEAVTNLLAEALSETEINLTWTASTSTDINKYKIYMNQPGSGAGGPYQYMGMVDSQTTDFLVKGLSENVTYYFVIISFDEADNPSVNSNEAMEITLAVPPAAPVLDTLPKITNIAKWNITGTATVGDRVFVYNNGIEIGNGSTNATGGFGFVTTLVEGINKFNARAVDQADLWSTDSLYQIIVLNTTKPVADAGPDKNISVGDTYKFDGTNSTDDNKVLNYTWTFEYDGETIMLFGPMPEFMFNETGTYEITLTVTDNAGNTDTDTITITVIEPKKVDLTPPVADAGPDQAKTMTEPVKITFDGSGSTDNIGVSNYTWTFTYNGSEVTLYGESPSFVFEIVGEYQVTLTVYDLTVPPNKGIDTMWVNITAIVEDNDTDADNLPDDWEDQHGFNKNDRTDATKDADEDELNNLDEFKKGTDPNDPDSDDDGLPDGWEVDNDLDPMDSEGLNGADGDPDGDTYTNLEEYNAKTNPQDPEEKPVDKKDDDDDDSEEADDNIMMFLALIILVIIIIAILAFALTRGKKAEEPVGALAEDEEAEETIDEDELENEDIEDVEEPELDEDLEDEDLDDDEEI